MAADPIRFELTTSERQSGLWQRLLAELRERRDVLRVRNDQPADEIETAMTRGRIAELSRLIDFDQLPHNHDEDA